MKQSLTRDEFAINVSGNAIQIDQTKAELIFTKVGTNEVQMNLSMTFMADLTKIQVGPGPIIFDSCGVYSFNTSSYIEGQFHELILNIAGTGPDFLVSIKSLESDISLLTNGTKGEHGNTFF